MGERLCGIEHAYMRGIVVEKMKQIKQRNNKKNEGGFKDTKRRKK